MPIKTLIDESTVPIDISQTPRTQESPNHGHYRRTLADITVKPDKVSYSAFPELGSTVDYVVDEPNLTTVGLVLLWMDSSSLEANHDGTGIFLGIDQYLGFSRHRGNPRTIVAKVVTIATKLVEDPLL